MIGDHMQLRPHLNNYEIERKYRFNISLFERFINNGMRQETLLY